MVIARRRICPREFDTRRAKKTLLVRGARPDSAIGRAGSSRDAFARRFSRSSTARVLIFHDGESERPSAQGQYRNRDLVRSRLGAVLLRLGRRGRQRAGRLVRGDVRHKRAYQLYEGLYVRVSIRACCLLDCSRRKGS